jgi:hypothetical protein
MPDRPPRELRGIEEGGVVDKRISCAGRWAAGAALFAAGCANGSEAVVESRIETSRVVENRNIDYGKQPSHAERFGLVTSAGPAPSPHGESKPPFGWKTPPGWTELPASTMRSANFRPGGDERAECYLTLLAGEAGGMTANINRWRSQLALPGLSAADVDALPRTTFFGREGTLVEATGTWKGMSGADSKADWSLLGVALVDPNGSVFLKMTGPRETITAQRDAFIALAASFGATAGAPHGAQDAQNRAGGFAFELPNDWRRGAEKNSRALSFWAGEGEVVECYVTVLGGTAGGELANVNRWRTQIGLEPVEQAAVDALDPFTMLGRPARIVELVGTNSAIYGVTSMGDDKSVFLKMTGPPDLVRKQRSAMLAFASSLKEVK